MKRISKKTCLKQGGTWRNGRCSLKRSSVTHKWTKKNPKTTQITLEGKKIKEKKDTITQKTLTGETIEQKKRKKRQRKGKTETETEPLFEKVTKEGRWEVWGGKQDTLKTKTEMGTNRLEELKQIYQQELIAQETGKKQRDPHRLEALATSIKIEEDIAIRKKYGLGRRKYRYA